MSHEFSDEVRMLNVHEPFCELCSSNENCSLHHIYGRISSSAVNAILLCQQCHFDADCYNQETGIKGDKFRKKLLKKRLRNLVRWGFEYKKKDINFLKRIDTDIIDILK